MMAPVSGLSNKDLMDIGDSIGSANPPSIYPEERNEQNNEEAQIPEDRDDDEASEYDASVPFDNVCRECGRCGCVSK